MGNLEKILVGIIIVTIVAILGLAIWGLGGHDAAKKQPGGPPPSTTVEKEPIPEAVVPSPAVTEIPSDPVATNEVSKIASSIDRLVNEKKGAAAPESPAPPSPAVQKPAPPSQPAIDAYPTLAERARKYVVKKGDTYEKIARSELGDVKMWRQIQDLNKDIPPNKLHPGSMIVLPSESGSAGVSKPAETSKPSKLTESLASSSDDPSYHTVKKGDTLYSLAREYLHDGSKWRLIADANPDKIRGSSAIVAGTRLRIPK